MPKHVRFFWSGLMYLVIGAIAIFLSRDFTMGTAVRMGPGYFPTVLGYLLALIGAASIIRSFIQEGTRIEGFAWGKIVFVTVSVVAFAVLLEGAGLVVAVLALIMISAAASNYFNWKHSLTYAVGTAVFCGLVFIKGLGLPMPLFGPWLGM